MTANSPQLTISFVILSYVGFYTHFDEYGNEIFYGSRAGFSVLVENIFIVDEHNDGTCNFDNYNQGGFYDKHMGLSVLMWSLMVIDEHKDDVAFR